MCSATSCVHYICSSFCQKPLHPSLQSTVSISLSRSKSGITFSKKHSFSATLWDPHPLSYSFSTTLLCCIVFKEIIAICNHSAYYGSIYLLTVSLHWNVSSLKLGTTFFLFIPILVALETGPSIHEHLVIMGRMDA